MSNKELVIKIPEITYNAILERKHLAICNDNDIYEWIKNGTLLPIGHGRLIDADEAIQRLCGKSCGCTLEECGYDVPCFSVQRINSAQTIIEADKGDKK